jgi:hypothetical protein
MATQLSVAFYRQEDKTADICLGRGNPTTLEASDKVYQNISLKFISFSHILLKTEKYFNLGIATELFIWKLKTKIQNKTDATQTGCPVLCSLRSSSSEMSLGLVSHHYQCQKEHVPSCPLLGAA